MYKDGLYQLTFGYIPMKDYFQNIFLLKIKSEKVVSKLSRI